MKNLFLLAGLMTVCACAINHLNDEKTVITLQTGTDGNPMVISLEKGPQWSHTIRPGPFVIHIYPQLVFWVEDDAGNLIKTLYISGADGKFSKHASKKKMGSEFFRECFPVWSDKVLSSHQKLPSSTTPYLDAVTSATPQSSFDVVTHLGHIKSAITLYAEINKSGDYNASYTKENSDWNGQPSVLYSVAIADIRNGQSYALKPVGHSDVSQNTPVFRAGFENLDTALEMVSEIRVTFR